MMSLVSSTRTEQIELLVFGYLRIETEKQNTLIPKGVKLIVCKGMAMPLLVPLNNDIC